MICGRKSVDFPFPDLFLVLYTIAITYNPFISLEWKLVHIVGMELVY